MKKPLRILALLGLGALLGGIVTLGRPSVSAQPQTPAPATQVRLQAISNTSFTYQGYLTDNGQPANGAFDFQFRLYNAPTSGTEISQEAFNQENVVVNSGLFTTTIDVGTSVFTGTVIYLDIAVRPGASEGGYTSLAPRQAITAVPYALTLIPPVSLNGSRSGNILSVSNDAGVAIRAEAGTNSQGSAITGYNNGTARYGAEIEILRTQNPRAAIYARTVGAGQSIDAEVNSTTTADALFARTTSPTAGSYAGVFSGPVQISCSAVVCNTANALQVVGNMSVSGTLSKPGGSFKIDHPLDPANRYLQHSFVESPDMKNIYDGVVTLDAIGTATITLPDWFEPLNMDFRYQLTAIGAPGPNLYIAQEIKANQFRIAGGTVGMKVSWQVTGTRHDAWANANRIPVESDKPANERGRYLFPQGFGQPATLQEVADDNTPEVRPPTIEGGR